MKPPAERKPWKRLGLEAVGLGSDGGKVPPLRTDTTGLVEGAVAGNGNGSGTGGGTEHWLYAVGDAAGKVMLTHQGKYSARATGDAIAPRPKGELEGTPSPWSRYPQTANDHAESNVVFTDPELASVGRSVEQAAKDGYNVASVELPISVAGSRCTPSITRVGAAGGGRRQESAARRHFRRPGRRRAAARGDDRHHR